MKKIVLCLSATLALCSLNAQTYSLKKGKLSADDVAIAKYDGKGGLLRSFKLQVTTMDGQPLIDLEAVGHDFENPLLEERKKYFTAFFKTNPEKKLVYKLETSLWVTEKMIMNILFKDGSPSLIKDNKLDAEVVDKFIADNNYDYVADSLSVIKMEEENKVRISTLFPRDTKKPVELRPAGNIKAKQLYDIYQDEMLIGRLEKLVDDTGFSPKYSYSVWMKTAPFTFDGKEYAFSPVAFFKDASSTFDNRVILMKNKSVIKFKTPGASFASAEYAFVNLLINTGNL